MIKRSIQDNIDLKGGVEAIKRSPRNEIYIILDNIRSMHNVGAIFRTADAARVKTLFLCGITATPPRSQIAKTALNTVEYVPWKHYRSTLRLVKFLKSHGVTIIGLEQTKNSLDYRKCPIQKPLALVVGNEIEGISDKVLRECDMSIEIPMQGIANSLNVATATGIALFHFID